MRITSVDIYDIILPERSYWNMVFLRINTDAGHYGLGEVSLAYGTGSKAGVGMLRQMAERFLIGADPFRIEDMWQKLTNRTFWGQGGGPVVYGAMSAIDEALWDIKGKALGVPVYELLGGKMRDKVRVYANGWYAWPTEGWGICKEPQDYAESALRTLELGYDALKFDPFESLSGPDWRYPPENPSRAWCDLAYDRVAAVREAVGPDIDVLIEVHGALGTAAAIKMGQRFADLDPMLYEEPVDTQNIECLKQVHDQVPIPIAAGERLYTRQGFRPYIEAQAIDILQPDMGLAGGISETRRIAAHAETYKLQMQPHLCAGPVAAAATLQLDAAMPNFLIQEWFVHHIVPLHVLVEQDCDTEIVGGCRPISDAPGLGVTLDEAQVGPYLCHHID